MSKVDLKEKIAITPKFRASFPKLFKPESFQGQPAKYSIVMLFDKATDISGLRKIAKTAAVEKFGADEKKWPKNMRSPFRDGDEKSDQAGYAGTIVVSASSKERPQVVDAKKIPIMEEDQTFYAGCYARAQVIAFAYSMAGNNGVSFALQHVQKLADGERFSGRKNAADVFDEYQDESDDAANYGI